jgi:hypothetical protein
VDVTIPVSTPQKPWAGQGCCVKHLMQLNWQCQRSIAELYPVAVKRWGLANHRELSHS